MKDYRLYVGGQDMNGVGGGNVHAVHARLMLDDVLTAVSLKRRLDKGGDILPDDEVLSRCALAGPEQLQAAAEAAHEAKQAWAAVPLERRLGLLARFHQELARRAGEFIELLIAEGHPRRFAEIEATSILDATGPEAIDFYRRQLVQEVATPGRHLKLVRKPDGVVGLNPPQNAATTNSAVGVCVLAAGNTLVLRAPQGCPTGVHFLFRELVAPLLDEIGAPPGTLNIITAPTALTLRHWIDSPLIDDVFYFGDSTRGLAIAQECMAKSTKPILELAGNDGLVVWRDADLAHAARALTESFIGSGQVCLVPKFGIVHPAVADELLARLLDEVARIRPTRPDDDAAWLSPVMKSERYFEFLTEAVRSGASVLAGGHRCDLDGDQDEAGSFIEPTVLRVNGLELADSIRAVREETFFPLLPIVVPDDPGDDEKLFSAVLEFLNGNRYGLRNSLWARDKGVIDRFCAELSVGGLLKVNDSHIGTVAPLPAHGGTGLSGGPFGEANLPIISTTHLQGISVAAGDDPRESAYGLRPRPTTHQS
ncbi:aldehyde dehydrogenase family protein [Streptomyces sp. ME19-01-6]|uniref:aldehyde dehydrogenase family protein n=1 Tax=Streptomyces sp. ME19-01-6 TaxID=3028686 RepID=UPI0029BA7239|nr:aldehyde dehydrogenase family protein [Streptomyces sp. ME19-01-6]MDX3225015.1 aldehyde dehydrogenase family protein [Streptomyces sp. ME19-01-6]